MPGAIPSACVAASIGIVPAPHIGSSSASDGSQSHSASSPAASVSRSGAAAFSCRQPRRCSRSPDESMLTTKRSSDPRSSTVCGCGGSPPPAVGGATRVAREPVGDAQLHRLGDRAGVIEPAARRAGADLDRAPGRDQRLPWQRGDAVAQLAELARGHLADAREHARRRAQDQIRAVSDLGRAGELDAAVDGAHLGGLGDRGRGARGHRLQARAR